MPVDKRTMWHLCEVLEWAKGNRGRQDINPYGVPEVKAALRHVAKLQGVADYLDARTARAFADGPNSPPRPAAGVLTSEESDRWESDQLGQPPLECPTCRAEHPVCHNEDCDRPTRCPPDEIGEPFTLCDACDTGGVTDDE